MKPDDILRELGELPGAVVLLSGGVDSTTLLHWVRQRAGVGRIVALSFTYGQKHARELEMARWQVAALGDVRHHEIDLSFFGPLTGGRSALAGAGPAVPDLAELSAAQRQQPPTYVPHRNLFFLSLAAAATEGAGVQHVFYGAQAQDEYGYWDCTPAFVERLNAVLGLNRDQAVRIVAPFVALPKGDVVKIGLALQVDYAILGPAIAGGEQHAAHVPVASNVPPPFKRLVWLIHYNSGTTDNTDDTDKIRYPCYR